jgi:hypothetical protein
LALLGRRQGLPYWQMNANGDEEKLKLLGIR